MVLKSNGAASLYITPNYDRRSSYTSFAVSDLHFATVYGLRTDLGGCKIRGGGGGGGGGCPQTPL